MELFSTEGMLARNCMVGIVARRKGVTLKLHAGKLTTHQTWTDWTTPSKLACYRATSTDQSTIREDLWRCRKEIKVNNISIERLYYYVASMFTPILCLTKTFRLDWNHHLECLEYLYIYVYIYISSGWSPCMKSIHPNASIMRWSAELSHLALKFVKVLVRTISFWVQVLSTYLWRGGKMMIDATHMMNLHLQQLSS